MLAHVQLVEDFRMNGFVAVVRFRDGRQVTGYSSWFERLRPIIRWALAPNADVDQGAWHSQIRTIVLSRPPTGAPVNHLTGVSPAEGVEVLFEDGEQIFGWRLPVECHEGTWLVPQGGLLGSMYVFIPHAAAQISARYGDEDSWSDATPMSTDAIDVDAWLEDSTASVHLEDLAANDDPFEENTELAIV